MSTPAVTREAAWEEWSHILEYIPGRRVSTPLATKYAQGGIKYVFKQQEIPAKILKEKSTKHAADTQSTKSESD